MSSDDDAGPRLLGTLGSADGKGVVRMQDHYDTDIEDLWSALTDPERLARWLGRIEGDLKPGGTFHRFFYASGAEGTGRIDVCEPPRLLRLTLATGSEEHIIEATLTADGDQTILVVVESGMPVNLLPAYGAGIQVHVEDLAAYIAGGERCDPDARWAELEPTYEALPTEIG